jgi:oligosaccharyltransferase complex subunit alpha (ribophorin I)
VSKSASDPSLRVLEFSFSVPFSEVVIREHMVRVILPEGAYDVEVHEPFELDGVTEELHHTILDTVGRPTLVLRKDNVVAEHNRIVRVSYRFARTAMLREPMFLTVAFALFFAACMVYVRIDLAIAAK